MRHVVVLGLLILSALAGPAVSAASPSLRALDREVQALRRAELPTEPAGAQAALKDLVERLGRVDALLGDSSPADRDAALLRAGEGTLHAARAIAESPCPPALDAVQCALYSSLLAERAAPLLQKASKLLDAAGQGALSGGDRRRIEGLTGLRSRLEEAVEAAPPAPSSRPPPEPTRPGIHVAKVAAPLPSQWALVWRDAWFSGVGQRLRARSGARGPGHSALWLVRVLQERDEVLVVETGGPLRWDQHCQTDRPLPSAYRLRLQVSRSDVLPVLARALTLAAPGGEELRLERGSPVFDEGVLVGELLLPVSPPASVLALRYEATELPEPGPNGAGSISGEGLFFDGRSVGFLRESYNAEGRLHVAAHEGDRVTVLNRCGRLTLRSSDVPAQEQSGLLGALLGDRDRSPLLQVAAGTVIHAPDGTPAGTLAEAITLPAHVLSEGPLRCTLLDFGSSGVHTARGSESSLQICFDPKDVAAP